MSFARYELIAPLRPAFDRLLKELSHEGDARQKRIDVCARKLGAMTVPREGTDDSTTLNVRLTGAVPADDGGGHIYGETGADSTVDIHLPSTPDFPPVATVTVPDSPQDMGITGRTR